jgi:hypothetical protein
MLYREGNINPATTLVWCMSSQTAHNMQRKDTEATEMFKSAPRSKWPLPSRVSDQTLVCILHLYAYNMTCPSHSSWFDNANILMRSYITPAGSKYSPEHTFSLNVIQCSHPHKARGKIVICWRVWSTDYQHSVDWIILVQNETSGSSEYGNEPYSSQKCEELF